MTFLRGISVLVQGEKGLLENAGKLFGQVSTDSLSMVKTDTDHMKTSVLKNSF